MKSIIIEMNMVIELTKKPKKKSICGAPEPIECNHKKHKKTNKTKQ